MTEFERIYRKYFNDVFLYVKKLSGSETIAEDITAEAFLKAMDALDKFKGNCDVRVWLCQIAKNCYISHMRKVGKEVNIEEFESALKSNDVSVEELMAKSDNLAELHEPYKEVFTLRIFAELSFKEIGEIFKKSDNWACVTFHRAKSKIKNEMEAKK